MKALLTVLLWLASLAAVYHFGCSRAVVLHTESVRRDTVRIVTPELMVIHARGSITERLPLTGSSDSACVEVPVEQAVYTDSSYKAYVSGFRPKLDSLVFVRTETHYTLPSRKEPKRWSLGIQAGYGITPRGPQPYVGIGVAFRIL